MEAAALKPAYRIGRTFANFYTAHIYSAHPCLRGKRDEFAVHGSELALTHSEFLLREHDDTSAFGSFIRK